MTLLWPCLCQVDSLPAWDTWSHHHEYDRLWVVPWWNIFHLHFYWTF